MARHDHDVCLINGIVPITSFDRLLAPGQGDALETLVHNVISNNGRSYEVVAVKPLC